MADDKSTRFWSNVRIGAPDECWEWAGARNHSGYGCAWFRADGHRFKLAHRVAHYLSSGEFPTVVMHLCDNPPCCNPAHLRGGTQRDNVADCIRKGRMGGFIARVCLVGDYCGNGHEYTVENTRWRVKRGYRFRVCRQCQRRYSAENRRRGRVAA